MSVALLAGSQRWRGLRWTLFSRSFVEQPRPTEVIPTSPPNPTFFENEEYAPPSVERISEKGPLERAIHNRDWQLATRLRDEILEDGQRIQPNIAYEKAAVALISRLPSSLQWLRLYPDAQHGPSNPLPTLRSVILASGQSPDVVYQVAMTLAEKGYASIVRDEFIPFLAKSTLPTDQKTTMLSTLQTATLPSLLPARNAYSTSFLEDEDLVDYREFAPTAEQARYRHDSPAVKLARHIRHNRLDLATQLLKELRSLGVPIAPSQVYVQAADAVYQTGKDAEDAVELFISWLELLPYHRDVPFLHMSSLCRHLFWVPSPDLRFVVPFLQIMAEKGFVGIVSRRLKALLYASDETILGVWDHVQISVARYVHLCDTLPPGEGQNSLALRGALNTRTGIARLSYDIHRLQQSMVRFLHKHERTELAKSISQPIDLVALMARVDEDTFTSTVQASELSNSRFTPEVIVQTLPHDTHKTFDNLAQALLYLRSISRVAVIPHIDTVRHFYHHYTLAGRTRALHSLRRRYIKLNPAAASVFLFCAMENSRNIAASRSWDHPYYRTALSIFYYNFNGYGVPMDELRQLAQRKDDGTDDQAAYISVANRAKLWPLPAHAAIVWECLLKCTHAREVDALWDTLLDVTYKTLRSGPAKWRDPTPFCNMFGLFLDRMMQLHGLQRGVDMLNQMQSVGVAPNALHYGKVAAFAAKCKDLETALFILGRLEQLWDAGGAVERIVELPKETSSNIPRPVTAEWLSSLSDDELEHLPPHTRLAFDDPVPAIGDPVRVPIPATPPRDQLFAPSVEVYIGIMRGLLMVRELPTLREVHQRFLKYFIPSDGANVHLDRLYRDWHLVRRGTMFEYGGILRLGARRNEGRIRGEWMLTGKDPAFKARTRIPLSERRQQ
ncbi:hypothetical protein CYLTODRAFT_417717 [Cylindrobasidium torrendii FP15055 ss-10]|uniref:Uncharacterized protein n=1 Tax=Cylindrobasidium torrendii FP15055 ss-10 TaxID=1314674 RepID=A0A0D7BQB8_9AGAR|nr:hypothetical protein CYLTODRAFT_417717 [Cylindrobasidium torrendii FP15055 ss-10]